MKTMFNLTTSSEDLDRFPEQKDLLELMEGFDGVELMQFEEDSRYQYRLFYLLFLHIFAILFGVCKGVLLRTHKEMERDCYRSD